MGIRQEMRNYGFRYEYGRNTMALDREELWMNEKGAMALRIEWLKLDRIALRAKKRDDANKQAGIFRFLDREKRESPEPAMQEQQSHDHGATSSQPARTVDRRAA